MSLPFVFRDKNPCNRVYFPRLLVYNVRMSYCTFPLITVNTCIKRQPIHMAMHKNNECMNLKRSVLFFNLIKSICTFIHVNTLCQEHAPITKLLIHKTVDMHVALID